MMGNDVERIKKVFQKKYPKLTITTIADYDKSYYIVEALENPNKPDFNSPWYGFNKRTGVITNFSPTADLDKFFNSVRNRMLYSTKFKNLS